MAISITLFKDPWNGCSFKCSVCDTMYDTRGKLRSHVVQKHHLKYKEEYLAQYGEPSVTIAKVNIVSRFVIA